MTFEKWFKEYWHEYHEMEYTALDWRLSDGEDNEEDLAREMTATLNSQKDLPRFKKLIEDAGKVVDVVTGDERLLIPFVAAVLTVAHEKGLKYGVETEYLGNIVERVEWE